MNPEHNTLFIWRSRVKPSVLNPQRTLLNPRGVSWTSLMKRDSLMNATLRSSLRNAHVSIIACTSLWKQCLAILLWGIQYQRNQLKHFFLSFIGTGRSFTVQ